jgi:hypothetical protein
MSCSGTNAYAYGTMATNVVSLTCVLASGAIVKTHNRPRKSSAGYDITHLVIGSEGTLALVTEAVLRLSPLPKASTLLWRFRSWVIDLKRWSWRMGRRCTVSTSRVLRRRGRGKRCLRCSSRLQDRLCIVSQTKSSSCKRCVRSMARLESKLRIKRTTWGLFGVRGNAWVRRF